MRKNRTGQHRLVTEVETGRPIPELTRQIPDVSIARLLSLLGKRTGHGTSWTTDHALRLSARVAEFPCIAGKTLVRAGN